MAKNMATLSRQIHCDTVPLRKNTECVTIKPWLETK